MNGGSDGPLPSKQRKNNLWGHQVNYSIPIRWRNVTKTPSNRNYYYIRCKGNLMIMFAPTQCIDDQNISRWSTAMATAILWPRTRQRIPSCTTSKGADKHRVNPNVASLHWHQLLTSYTSSKGGTATQFQGWHHIIFYFNEASIFTPMWKLSIYIFNY